MKNKKLIIAAVLALIAATIAYFGISSNLPQDTNYSSDETSNQQMEAIAHTDPVRASGEAFMDSIAKADSVQALGAGICYKVITMGSGPKPTAANTVSVNYEGRLIDGTVFDSSYERLHPAEFPVDAVIEGWQYALKAMPVGSKWEVYIPWYYAYKETGTSNIPPYSALIFTIELLDIVQ